MALGSPMLELLRPHFHFKKHQAETGDSTAFNGDAEDSGDRTPQAALSIQSVYLELR